MLLAAMIVVIHLFWLVAGASLARLLRDPLSSRIISLCLAAALGNREPGAAMALRAARGGAAEPAPAAACPGRIPAVNLGDNGRPVLSTRRHPATGAQFRSRHALC
jgi:hypothetical protein